MLFDKCIEGTKERKGGKEGRRERRRKDRRERGNKGERRQRRRDQAGGTEGRRKGGRKAGRNIYLQSTAALNCFYHQPLNNDSQICSQGIYLSRLFRIKNNRRAPKMAPDTAQA